MLNSTELASLFEDATADNKRGSYTEPYKNLRFLLIEDQEVSRKSLQMSVQAMGGKRIDMAQSHSDAVARIKANIPDVIICDYMLGNGRTGQQLLEELRRRDNIPESVAFVMVTAERSYEQVVAAAELAPDDYIIKPFSPETLRTRLERVLRKKIAFNHYYLAKAAEQHDLALLQLDTLMRSNDAALYRYDIMRCRAATLMASQQIDAAIQQYESILTIHPFPWAKVGLARALRLKNRLTEARSTIEEVIVASPNFFEAYDLKADICCDQGDYTEAQATLTAISAKTPRNYQRKRALSEAATLNGDFETARKVINDVIANDTLSNSSVSVADCLTLARAAIDQGDLSAAKEAMFKLPLHYINSENENSRLVQTCLNTLLDHGSEEGEKQFTRIRAQLATTLPDDVEAGLDAVRLALTYEDLELADRIASQLLLGNDSKHAFHSMLSLFRTKNQEDHFRQLQREAAKQMLLRKQKEQNQNT